MGTERERMNKLQRFKEGLKNLTPLQQLNAKATGSLWGAIGLSIAFIGMIYNLIKNFSVSQLGFSIFVFVLVIMQIIQFIGTKQQIALVKLSQQTKEEEEELKGL